MDFSTVTIVNGRKRVKPTLLTVNISSVKLATSNVDGERPEIVTDFSGSKPANGFDSVCTIPKAGRLGPPVPIPCWLESIDQPLLSYGKKALRTPDQVYLGLGALPVDQIFYGNTALDQELYLDEDLTSTPGNFNITPSEACAGQRLYVNARMKFFLRSPQLTFEREGREHIGIRTYPDFFGIRRRPLSMTIFSKLSDRVTATRSDCADWIKEQMVLNDLLRIIAANKTNDMTDDDEDCAWQARQADEKWRNVYGTNDEVTVLVHTDSEDEVDPKTMKEIQKEANDILKAKERAKSKILSRQEVERILDISISRISDDWIVRKQPKLEPKGWSLWTKSRRQGTTEAQIHDLKRNLAMVNVRIEKARAAIAEQQWKRSLLLVKQCSALQNSIFQREEGNWRVNVLRQERPPVKPAPRQMKVKLVKPLMSMSRPDDDSETSLDDFIVEDEPTVPPSTEMSFQEEEPMTSYNDSSVLLGDIHPERQYMPMLDNGQNATFEIDPPTEETMTTHYDFPYPIPDNHLGGQDALIINDEQNMILDTTLPTEESTTSNHGFTTSMRDIHPDGQDIPISDDHQKRTLNCVLPTQQAMSSYDNLTVSMKDIQPEEQDDLMLEDDQKGTLKRTLPAEDEAMPPGGVSDLTNDNHRELEPRSEVATSFGRVNEGVVVNQCNDRRCPVYLNPDFGNGKRIKPHQIRGLQFLWREIVAQNVKSQGCLLAQTMGLGKTMQVIALLVTLAEAGRSIKYNIYQQVPPPLRDFHILVVCPPALVENWWDEFILWVPKPYEKYVGRIWRISAVMTIEDRLKAIYAWKNEERGVLLIGYNNFKDLIHNKNMAKNETNYRHAVSFPLSDVEHRKVKRVLLRTPSLIVADEAHNLKSSRSKLTQAVTQLKSRSRIALTGSPLNNHLEEYYTIVDWMAPGYLGTLGDFKAIYETPILEGLADDSTDHQYRHARKRLKALELTMDPKIHRASATVLLNNLPEKFEYLIKVKLTPIQELAYKIFIKFVCSADIERTQQHTTLWSWIGYLKLLCNHPKCYWDKLLQVQAEGPYLRKSRLHTNHGETRLGSLELNELDEDENLVLSEASGSLATLSLIAKESARAFDELMEPLESPLNSNKMVILMKIIECCGIIRQKVLVFTHSIPTLDYVGQCLFQAGKRYARIYGETPVKHRQEMTKEFNEGGIEVCLISTRAGGVGLNLFGKTPSPSPPYLHLLTSFDNVIMVYVNAVDIYQIVLVIFLTLINHTSC